VICGKLLVDRSVALPQLNRAIFRSKHVDAVVPCGTQGLHLSWLEDASHVVDVPIEMIR